MTASAPAMRFSVDAWDAGYGTALAIEDEDLLTSSVGVETDVEVPADRWAPVAARGNVAHPSAVLFVDGVRRIDAGVWIDDRVAAPGAPASTASMGVCASYAAGVVCCCGNGNGNGAGRRAHLVAAEIRRGLFTTAAHASSIATIAGEYRAHPTATSDTTPLTMTLSNALQVELAKVELDTARQARDRLVDEHDGAGPDGHGGPGSDGPGRSDGDDLLVIDGPLRNRASLPRALGYIKTHRVGYLPPALNAVVAALRPGERSPVFGIRTSWERHAWYLRLPCVPDGPGAPWAGVVRCEAAHDLPPAELTALAALSQSVLVRYASVAYKEPRAPQNLVPIAGLEALLRHRLGDNRVMYRALRGAAGLR